MSKSITLYQEEGQIKLLIREYTWLWLLFIETTKSESIQIVKL